MSRPALKDEFIRLCAGGRLKDALRQPYRDVLWSDAAALFPRLFRACRALRPLRQLHAFAATSGAATADRFTANHLMLAYADLGDLSAARGLFEGIPRRNVMSWNILLGGYIKNGDLDGARRVFDEMPERNVASWNAMVAGLTNFGLDEESLGFFVDMRREGMHPDEFGLGSVFRCCAGIRDVVSGRQVHAYVVRSGLDRDMCVGSSLSHMYMRCGCLQEGETVLQMLPSLSIVSCNTIIAGRTQNGDSEGALEYFCMMRGVGVAADVVTFVSAISSCSDLAALAQGQQIHAQVVKVGVDKVVPVMTCLVHMYSRCGCLGDSETIFFGYCGSDAFLLSAMISAYGFHGHGQKAIELFKQMIDGGVEPSEVTFLALLYACSHSGLKEEGMNCFELMTKTYGLQPSVKHYTCVVDLLGRSGCLDEAEALILSMPVTPDGVIWKTLLSACKTQKNFDMAERIAKRVIELDPHDSAPYVLLSNIRATSRRWGDVSEVRKAMREKNVRKEPGVSWVELKGQIHQFCTGDESHPRQKEIIECLEEMIAKIRQCGYAPDMSMVLHDMEDEEKEISLSHHSEKLAIAFAFLSLPEGVPIRVMKNLRVCDDCHVAIKLMAQILDKPHVAGGWVIIRPPFWLLASKGCQIQQRTPATDRDFAVTDAGGAAAMRAEGAVFGLRKRTVLANAASGRPVLTMLDAASGGVMTGPAWDVFRGESSSRSDLLFSAVKESVVQIRTTKVFVYLSGYRSVDQVPDFVVRGSYHDGDCSVFAGNSDDNAIAQVRCVDSQGMCIRLGSAQAFIVSLAVILHQMHHY
uniref:DYW domain-containing protein n=1 Tax=Leersia perrieri TaxID=77586 RepID=A0A0D9W0P3_9ORYZ